jgi:hypothetical protein
MDFQLSEDQQMLKDMVRKISLNEFAPKAEEIDEKEEFPWDNKKILEENGLLGIQIPEEYGGAGAGMVSLAIVVEEVARVCASTSVILTTQALATDPLLIGAGISLTGASYSSQMVGYLMSSPSLLILTGRRGIRALACLSSPKTPLAFQWAKRKRNWASVGLIPESSFLKTASFQRKIELEWREKALRF